MATLLKPRQGNIWRFYKSTGARKSALRQLQRSGRYNYFVLYQDVHGPAIHAAHAIWVKPGEVYVD